MSCEKCGIQLLNKDIKFCPNCGNRVNPSEQGGCQEDLLKEELGFSRSDTEYIKPEILKPEILLEVGHENNGENKAKKPFRVKFLLAFVPVLIVVLLIFAYVFKPTDHEVFPMISNKVIEVYYDSANHSTVILNTSGEILHMLNMEATPYYNMHRTAAILYTATYINDNPEIQIYYVDAKNLVELNHDIGSADISNDGNYLVYRAQINGEGNILYQYDVKRKKETVLDQSTVNRFFFLEMSPDGQTVLYNTRPKEVQDIRQEFSTEVFMIKNGGEPVSQGKDIFALAVSDHGEYKYFCDFNFENQSIKSLFLQKGNKTIKLFEDIVDSYIYFKKDYTEVMYTDGEKTYLYSVDGDIIPVADTVATEVLIPPRGNSYSNMMSENQVRYYDFETFRNKVILCDDNNLRVIDMEEKAPAICSVNTNIGLTLSEDGKSLLYLSSEGNLHKINDLSGQYTDETYIINPYSFIASGDLSEVYYRKDNQLYYKRGNFEPKLIADNVSSLIWNTEQTQELFEADKEGGKSILYSCSHGDEPEVALDYGNHIMQKLNYGVIVQTFSNSEYRLFYNTEGSRMKQIIDNTNNYN
jgi:hypothetical protein